jgi:hypothetical protein
VYRNITFVSLGALLGIETGKAERIAAKMVAEGRLAGSIDQVAGVLDFAAEATGEWRRRLPRSHFNPPPPPRALDHSRCVRAGKASGAGGGGAGGGAGAASAAAGSMAEVAPLLAWDGSIKAACLAVNGVVEAIGKAHPHLLPS